MIVLIDTVVNLLSEKIEPDELGNQISVLTKKPIFATISSVTQSEYFKAATIALKHQYKIAGVFFADYNNEKYVEIDGCKHEIYRTYRDGDYMELYVTERIGVIDG